MTADKETKRTIRAALVWIRESAMRDYLQKVNKIARNPSAEALGFEYQRAPTDGTKHLSKKISKNNPDTTWRIQNVKLG
jgi:hypothetical protein